ncbi:transposase [Pollutimonas subterranea]|uniref:transposase n=1 Tax=Pollutimonas subterranea TaxID=2045210 RepID=UPI001303FFEF|nr:transposase [Pollutimonas subterranea]
MGTETGRPAGGDNGEPGAVRHLWVVSFRSRGNVGQQALYFAKQQLNGFLVMEHLKAKRAKQLLPKFLALIRQFEQGQAKALAATLTSWLEPIVRMWRFAKSNGITEGFYTKVEMLSRRAYGLRNFENYRMRVPPIMG